MNLRMQLKRDVMSLLEANGREHPVGHQASKVQRYVLATSQGRPMEVMFEKNDEVPANLWCDAKIAKLVTDVPSKSFPRALLWNTGKDGKLKYGRHSSLRSMPQLKDADLVKFQLQTLDHGRRVIDAILNFSK